MKEIHIQNHVIEQTKASEWKAVVDELLQLNQQAELDIKTQT